MFGACKQFLDSLEPEIENPLYIAAHFQCMDHPADDSKRKPVSDNVCHPCPCVPLFESMGVVPKPIRAAQLHIDKAKRWVPPSDSRRPAHADAVPTQPVTDLCTGRDPDRTGRENAKPQPRRRQIFKVAGIGKKGEDIVM